VRGSAVGEAANVVDGACTGVFGARGRGEARFSMALLLVWWVRRDDGARVSSPNSGRGIVGTRTAAVHR
jgi:hypothetical protein